MSWKEADLALCNSLEELLNTATSMMRELKTRGLTVHYVAGPVSADGEENIPRNLAELLRRRELLATNLGECAVVITAPLVFTSSVYERIRIFGMPTKEREVSLREFWDSIIASDCLDSIYFMPGFERSVGSVAEHQAAIRHGVPIHYLD